ncbi:MAG: hypothetical protein KDC35_03420 [Acidobacteria bacterium]|nr:hypothetical protein [Acidobacteriota bacterium]
MIAMLGFLWLGEVVAVQVGQEARLIDLTTLKVQSHAGQLITRTSEGMLVQSDQAMTWIAPDGETKVFQSIGETPISLALQQVSSPLAVTPQAVYLADGQEWRRIDHPMWIDFHKPTTIAGGATGLTAIGYHLIQTGPNSWVSYEPKTGHVRWIQGTQISHEKLDRKLRLTQCGDRVVWLGRPSESRVGLADANNPMRIVQSIAITDLSEYSFCVVNQDRLWLGTFSDAVRTLLKNWENSRMTLTLWAIDVVEGRVIYHTKTDVPLSIEVGASPSGSPRLNPKLDFTLLPVFNSRDLAVELPHEVRWVSTSHTTQTQARTGDEIAYRLMNGVIQGINTHGKIVSAP